MKKWYPLIIGMTGLLILFIADWKIAIGLLLVWQADGLAKENIK